MASAQHYDIVIVGAGISGLATALALYREGIRSVVLEKWETLRAKGAGIIIQPNGWQALDHLGVASVLRPTAIPITSGHHVSLSDGNRSEIPLGGELRCLRRTDLIKALADNLPPDTIQYGCNVVSMEVNNDHHTTTSNPLLLLHLDNGRIVVAKIVIGCDGWNSTIAKALGVNSTKLFSTCVARGFTYYEKGHEFDSQFLVLSRQEVQLGRLPVTDKLVYWFVTRKWTSQDSAVSRDPELIKESTLEWMKKGFPLHAVDMIEKSDVESLHLTDLRYRWPWELLRGKFLRRGSGPSVTVAGDAMHAMGPFLAQGGSASLEDAVVLGRCLAQALSSSRKPIAGSDRATELMVKKALDRYMQERRMRVFWLSLQTYLVGKTLDASSSSTSAMLLIRIWSTLLLIILFRDPIGHTRCDCRRI